MSNPIFDRVVAVMRGALNDLPEDIEEGSTFDELGIDSLDAISLSVEFEDYFGVNFDDLSLDILDGELSVGAIATALERALA